MHIRVLQQQLSHLTNLVNLSFSFVSNSNYAHSGLLHTKLSLLNWGYCKRSLLSLDTQKSRSGLQYIAMNLSIMHYLHHFSFTMPLRFTSTTTHHHHQRCKFPFHYLILIYFNHHAPSPPAVLHSLSLCPSGLIEPERSPFIYSVNFSYNMQLLCTSTIAVDHP